MSREACRSLQANVLSTLQIQVPLASPVRHWQGPTSCDTGIASGTQPEVPALTEHEDFRAARSGKQTAFSAASFVCIGHAITE